uniref:Uncharacterized protein ycf35 n=1 Tax=Alsidium seaforthii TaxID=2007182 RepID=A0A1Z1MCP3_9FLOR|nr:hypothetical protein [Bryothamnion seaforthii]ARW63858.1 hypothetical protein [Bryothamnion seaforthii]
MSHFSKIKTNISNLDALKKTITQLGFNYEIISHTDNDPVKIQNIVVYDFSDKSQPLFSFLWNENQYSFIVDLQLWNLDVDVNYFLDSLSQKYAYNVILNTSNLSGFHQISEKVSEDGSIKITLQRWSTNYAC